MLALAPAVIGEREAQASELSTTRSDLDQLKQRIRNLQQEVRRTESDRAGALKAVAEAEREVSRVQRRLLQSQREQAAVKAEVKGLEEELAQAQVALAGKQEALAQWLYRHYVQGSGEGVAPLLAARDPSQLARDAYYSERLGRVRLGILEEVRAELRVLAERRRSIAERQTRLQALARRHQAERDRLEAGLQTRQQALATLSAQLKAQKLEVSSLREDEQRLSRLINRLVARAREAAARERAQREARERAARAARAAQAPAAAGVRRGEVIGHAETPAPAPQPAGASFPQLRGKLHFPVRGQLVGRFGAARAEGGTSWKGVFIRVGTGADVKAVAAGEVVFSDWLRGYGNLIIVDHGHDYLTVYGNNDSLLKEVGERVAGGEAIASVGSSDGGGDSGLYFELRHQGRPLDPLQWVRLN